MTQTAIEWLVEELQNSDWIPKDSLIMDYVVSLAKEKENKQIEDVFEWLTTQNYLTDLKETMIKDYYKFKKK